MLHGGFGSSCLGLWGVQPRSWVAVKERKKLTCHMMGLL